MTSRPVSWIVAWLLCLPGAAIAADHNPSDVKHPTVLGSINTGTASPAAERAFVEQIGQGVLLQRQAGRMAARRSVSPTVLVFGRWIADEAAEDQQTLRRAAGIAMLGMPARLDAPARQTLAHLASLSGLAFESAFLHVVIQDQGRSVRLLQDQAQHGRAQPLVFYAQHQLPILQSHVEEARDLAKRAPDGPEPSPAMTVEPQTMRLLQQQETARLGHAP